jgi:multiple sugar transport system permease protein
MRHSLKFRLVQYIFALVITVFILAPFAWFIITSILHVKDLTTVPFKWSGNNITWQRYIDVFTNPDNEIAYTFRISMINSSMIAVSVAIIAIIIGGLAAYAFARLRFKFRKKLIYLFLFTYMIPPMSIIIPLYLILSKLGMLDSKVTLGLLNLTFIIPFVIWIMQSYFKSISSVYEESAAIDGCNRLQIMAYNYTFNITWFFCHWYFCIFIILGRLLISFSFHLIVGGKNHFCSN